MQFSINGVSLGLRRYSVSAFFMNMKTIKRIFTYFRKTELIIFFLSISSIIVSFCVFDKSGYLNLISSLIGVTSLLLCAKGNPLGLVLSIIFSIFYGIISYKFRYYGEMITYVAMTLPMCTLSLISWLKHPYKNKKSQVSVNQITKKDLYMLAVFTVIVTTAFYFILKALNTPNLIPSTFSVATSFAAVFLNLKRSPYYLIAYALNDIVLIVLWVLACFESITYISVVICFIAFLVNDIYGFINWKRMEKSQIENL